MKLTLIENAKDSLEHSIEHLVKEDGPRVGNLKRVILDLSHTVELILKERLVRIHPAFAYSNIDKYPSKDAYMVSTDDALKRLVKIGRVSFTDEDKTTIYDCKKKRNSIEHFEFEIEEKEAEIIIGRILSFILAFSQNELELDWQSELINNNNWSKLSQLSEFWDVHSKTVISKLEKNEIPTETCPTCSIETFDLESLRCHLCGHKEELVKCQVCKKDFLESLVDDPELKMCPQCIWEDGYASAHCEKY